MSFRATICWKLNVLINHREYDNYTTYPIQYKYIASFLQILFLVKLFLWFRLKTPLPPVRYELTTPGLRGQCSNIELRRLAQDLNTNPFINMMHIIQTLT